jgi:paraquat-inducible protein A
MSHQRKLAAVLVALCCLAFGMALVLPLFSIQPAAGRWTGVAKLLAADQFATRSFTLLDGILILWKENEPILAIFMALISLVFPVLKLSVLWWEIFRISSLSEKFLSAVRAISRYAMVEVLLIALLVLMVKGMPGGSEVKIQAGAWFFTASVVLSLLASRWPMDCSYETSAATVVKAKPDGKD